MPELPVQFEDHAIRRVYDEPTETGWFSVVDIIKVLTQQPDSKIAGNYWRVLKSRLLKEGSETITKCNGLKMTAEDGKQRLTDVATAETLLRLVQSIPSPKAEPIKLWLAKVGYERMQEMADPALSLDRAREMWQKHGRSDRWDSASAAHDVTIVPLLNDIDLCVTRIGPLLGCDGDRMNRSHEGCSEGWGGCCRAGTAPGRPA
jgi:hypothetical protein